MRLNEAMQTVASSGRMSVKEAKDLDDVSGVEGDSDKTQRERCEAMQGVLA